MKNSIFYLFTATIIAVSCQKASEPHVTSFQLEVRDYFTGDSMANHPFRLTGAYTSSYNFNQVTNEYGRFDTIFTHEQETDFDCMPLDATNFFIAKSTGQVKGGANTEVVLELIPYANFSYHFDCNFGNGFIQNVQRSYICPDSAETNVQNIAASQSQYIPSPVCGNYMSSTTVFSGTWVVTYEKKTSTSGAWSTYTDTVAVDPGANFIYTIAY